MVGRMTGRKWDTEGLEGLPFKLIIVSLILAISMPIVISNWMSYDRQQTINQLITELNYAGVQMDQIYDNGLGIGNSKMLRINVKDGAFAKIEYVKIGDSGLNSIQGRSIQWKLTGEDEQLFLLPDGIPARSEDGSSYVLNHGANELYLEIKEEGGLVFVEVSRL